MIGTFAETSICREDLPPVREADRGNWRLQGHFYDVSDEPVVGHGSVSPETVASNDHEIAGGASSRFGGPERDRSVPLRRQTFRPNVDSVACDASAMFRPVVSGEG